MKLIENEQHFTDDKRLYTATYFMVLVSVCAAYNCDRLLLANQARSFIHSIFTFLIWSLLLGTGVVISYRFRVKSKLVPAAISLLLMIIAIVRLILSIGTGFIGPILMVFLSILLLLKSVTLFTRRDFLYTYLISLILIIYSASISRDAFFLLYLLTFSVSGVFVLIYDNISEKRMHVYTKSKDNFFSSGSGITVVITFVAVLLYLCIPRFKSSHISHIPSDLLSPSADAEDSAIYDQYDEGISYYHILGYNDADVSDRGGDSYTDGNYYANSRFYDSGQSGNMRPVFLYLKADGDMLARENVYTRFYFEENIWRSLHPSMLRLLTENRMVKLYQDSGYNGELFFQSYEIVSDLPQASLFASLFPFSIEFPSRRITLYDTMALEAPYKLKAGLVYNVYSIAPKDQKLLKLFDYLNKDERLDNLALPDSLPQRIADLTHSITANKSDEPDRIRVLQAYLKENYRVNYSKAAYSGKPFLEEFLFSSKAGSPDLFATALAVMLRIEQIPSRLVTGFVADWYNFNPVTGYYEVGNDDRYTWVEAYMSDKGWVSLLPTENIDIRPRSSSYFMGADILNYFRTKARLFSRQGMIQHMTMGIPLFLLDVLSWIEDGLSMQWNILKQALIRFKELLFDYSERMMIEILVISFLVYAGYWLSKCKPRKSLNKKLILTDPRKFVSLCFMEFLFVMTRNGYEIRRGETPSEFSSRLKSSLGEQHVHVADITEMFSQARYSRLEISREDSRNMYDNFLSIKAYLTRVKSLS